MSKRTRLAVALAAALSCGAYVVTGSAQHASFAAPVRGIAKYFLNAGAPAPFAFAQQTSVGRPVAIPVGSADGIWETPSADAAQFAARLAAPAGRSALVRLNKERLDQLLANAPLEDTAPGIAPVTIFLPLPDGRFARFKIVESAILSPELAAAFPEIRTYRAEGLDDPTATGRIGWTSVGFHAIVIAAGGSVYVDPARSGDTENYVSLGKADLPDAQNFICLVSDLTTPPVAAQLPLTNGGTRRTYRLALAATGEYTALAGGTKALALSRMVTTINRVNGIYERDLAVRLTMSTGTAADPTALIFTDSTTDGYTDASGSAMLGENQTKLDAVIGNANYDIGHVFSTGGGGLAGLGVVCTLGSKARGVTGSSNPTGDAFDVDYAAHEIGHQFGANHPFNASSGSCSGNRSAAHAIEPGSGSTIMGYAGICNAENLQSHSNDYFNVESLNEITTYLAAGGAACATTAATGNVAPTVSAGSNYTIPQQTPFTLTATGGDANGDALTYTWEEYDTGGPTSSPASIATDDGSRPLLRSYGPTTNASRTFPSLPFVLANANVPPQTYSGASVVVPVVCGGTCATGEVLPSTNRTMTFQVTARDNRAGGGGLTSSQTSITVTTSAGPFRVTSPNTAVKWQANTTRAVTWNEAGTSGAPVSSANVRISLSTDGGLTFPTVILPSTPNDGTEDITVPNVATTTARIKVEAVDNIFFDISDANFEIEPTNVALALVVDDTGSMGEEIGAVRTALTNTIARLAADSTKPFPTTAIVTFKDDVTTHIISNDPVKLQPVVDSLVADGGDDCPESSNAALIVAGNLLSKDGTAMLFTDADSRPDGPARSDVLNVYLPKSLRLSVLLSGACSEFLSRGSSRPFRISDNHATNGRTSPGAAGKSAAFASASLLGEESAVRTFSELAAETRGTFVAIPEVNDTPDGVTTYVNTGANVAVSAVLPTVTHVSPSAVPRGVMLRVAVTGANTNFQNSSGVTVSGLDVTMLSTTVTSSTTLVADLVVGPGAATGFRDVTVTTSLGRGTIETAVGVGSLQITVPPDDPTIVGLSPFQVLQGSTQTLTITGVNTHFAADVTEVSFGFLDSGVTVNSVSVLGPTTLTVNMTVDPDAAVGYRDVFVDVFDSSFESAGENVVGPLLIMAPPPAIPRVLDATPAVGSPGHPVTVTLRGQNTHFAAGSSTVAFSGSGITVNSVDVSSATALDAVISIAADAQLEFKDVAVTTGAEVAVLFDGFNVSAATRTIVAGTRVSFSLPDSATARWFGIDAVAGRSYCAQIAAGSTAVDAAVPGLTAFRADSVTTLASETGMGARACFVAPQTETALIRITQTDSTSRPYFVSVVETTIWANWFYIGGSYSSFTLLRNTGTAGINAVITWRADTGGVVGTVSVTVPAGGVVYYDARDKTNHTAAAGSVEIAHDGAPNGLVGSQTTLTPTSGLSFDTVTMSRIPR